MVENIPLGCELDSLFGGGILCSRITQLYGPSGSGKTVICLQALVNAVKAGKKPIFVDPEGSFSRERIDQMAGENSNEVFDNTWLLEPSSFSDQAEAIRKVVKQASEENGLIIVDSIVYHYRLELNNGRTKEVNRELGKQLALLLEAARKKNIAVLVTNHVYSDLDSDEVTPVGGDVMKYSSKVIIKLSSNPVRKAEIVKHQFRKEGKEKEFRIVGAGVTC